MWSAGHSCRTVGRIIIRLLLKSPVSDLTPSLRLSRFQDSASPGPAISAVLWCRAPRGSARRRRSARETRWRGERPAQPGSGRRGRRRRPAPSPAAAGTRRHTPPDPSPSLPDQRQGVDKVGVILIQVTYRSIIQADRRVALGRRCKQTTIHDSDRPYKQYIFVIPKYPTAYTRSSDPHLQPRPDYSPGPSCTVVSASPCLLRCLTLSVVVDKAELPQHANHGGGLVAPACQLSQLPVKTGRRQRHPQLHTNTGTG